MSDDGDFHEQSQRLRLVARARDQSEYDIFVAAWRAWHGNTPPGSQIDADFDAYLREQAMPPYVRHFVRHWLDANPDVRRQSVEDRRAVRRARLLALVLIALAVILALLLGRPH